MIWAPAGVLRALFEMIFDIKQGIETMSATIQSKIDALKQDVAAEHDARVAAEKAFTNYAQQIKDLAEKAKGGDTDAIIADLEAMHQTLSADASALAAAVVANTPADTGGSTVSGSPTAGGSTVVGGADSTGGGTDTTGGAATDGGSPPSP